MDSGDMPDIAAHVAALQAAAAAAVEKPTYVGAQPSRGYGRPSRVERRAPDLQNSIHKAQMEAERRRSGATLDLESRIHSAQLESSLTEAGDSRHHSGCGFGRRSHWLPSAQELMGNWVDMQGNPVLVHSVDAYEMRLVAAVSRPSTRDLQLGLLAGSCGSLGHGATLAPRRPTPEGEGWICGNATLDLAASSLAELHWIGPRGRYSVWVRGKL
ncbi:unnamed protein product [Effrenium voratum]|nr:unnamed protein product [Effrenium voratum]